MGPAHGIVDTGWMVVRNAPTGTIDQSACFGRCGKMAISARAMASYRGPSKIRSMADPSILLCLKRTSRYYVSGTMADTLALGCRDLISESMVMQPDSMVTVMVTARSFESIRSNV